MPNFNLRVDGFKEFSGSVDLYTPPLYFRHKRDHEIMGHLRACASTDVNVNTKGCPAVWVLNDPIRKVEITKYWQFYIDRGINSNMPVGHALRELGYTRAIANGTGYGKPGVNRANWVTRTNLSDANPLFDKDRTFSNAMLQTIDGKVHWDVPLLFRNYRAAEDQNKKKLYHGYVIVKMFDGSKPPPLKPGKRQPERWEDVNPDDYLHHPKNPEDWGLFFALNIVNLSGDLVPFAGGALYDWYFNKTKPVCFYPHITNSKIVTSNYGSVKYPVDLLEKLPTGTSRVSPYTK